MSNRMMEYVERHIALVAWLADTLPTQADDWEEEEKLHQGFKEEEFAFLSDMLGPKGVAFDNDDYLDDNDDEDLKNDPVSQMDMQVSGLLSCSM